MPCAPLPEVTARSRDRWHLCQLRCLRTFVGMTAIEMRGLRKTYGKTLAVEHLDLHVEPGEVVGIMGRNGAGKSTTVGCIAGTRRPDAGVVRVLGLDPQQDRRALRTVLGVQPQHAHFHVYLTALELTTLFRSFYPRGRDPRAALESVGLMDQAGVRFDRLSGGQQQRLSIAIALIGLPQVVILDELTTGLDPRARRRLWELVEGLREAGVTVLLVSHHMDEVERLCQRVVLMDNGLVTAQGTVSDVINQAGLDADATLEDAFLALTGHRPGDDESEEETW